MLPAGMKRPSGRVKPGSGTMIEVSKVLSIQEGLLGVAGIACLGGNVLLD